MYTAIAALAAFTLGQAGSVQRVRTFDNIKAIAIAGSPVDSRFAVSQENSSIRIINAANLNAPQVGLVGHPQPAYALAWNNAGTQVVSGDETARIYVWDAKSGRKVREFPRNAQTHGRGIQSLRFSPDGKTLISTGKDDVIILWEFATAKIIKRISGNGVVFASALMPNSKTLLSATLTEGLHRRSYPGLNLNMNRNAHAGQGLQDLAADKTGTRIVSAGRDMKIGIWNGTNGSLITYLAGHSDSVQKVAISPSGLWAASSANDRLVNVYSIAKRQRTGQLKDQCAVGSPLAFSADGKFLMTVNVNDNLQLNRVQ